MFYLNLFLTIGLISCCVSLVCIVVNVLCCHNTPEIIEKIGNVAIPISLFFFCVMLLMLKQTLYSAAGRYSYRIRIFLSDILCF